MQNNLPELTPEQLQQALEPHVQRWYADQTVFMSDVARDTHLSSWKAWQAFYATVEAAENGKVEGKRTA